MKLNLYSKSDCKWFIRFIIKAVWFIINLHGNGNHRFIYIIILIDIYVLYLCILCVKEWYTFGYISLLVVIGQK